MQTVLQLVVSKLQEIKLETKGRAEPSFFYLDGLKIVLIFGRNEYKIASMNGRCQ